MSTPPQLQKRFSEAQLAAILEQAAIYSCACPAQLCMAINQQRELFGYQAGCLNESDTDITVHRLIAETAASNHANLEACLHKVLELEGWNMQSLEMPDNLGKRLIAELTRGE